MICPIPVQYLSNTGPPLVQYWSNTRPILSNTFPPGRHIPVIPISYGHPSVTSLSQPVSRRRSRSGWPSADITSLAAGGCKTMIFNVFERHLDMTFSHVIPRGESFPPGAPPTGWLAAPLSLGNTETFQGGFPPGDPPYPAKSGKLAPKFNHPLTGGIFYA